MEQPIFYHPITGEILKATKKQVLCSSLNCEGGKEVLTIWDLGSGVYCGGCGELLIPPTPEGLTVITDKEMEELPEWLIE